MRGMRLFMNLAVRRGLLGLLGFGLMNWESSLVAAELNMLPVPTVIIYPGDVIKDNSLVDRDFSADFPTSKLAAIDSRAALVGKVARRTLMPGFPIPASAVGDPKAVANGAKVRLLYEDGALAITAYGTALQAGSVGEIISVPESWQRVDSFGKRAGGWVGPRRWRLTSRLWLVFLLCMISFPATASVRIKDITTLQGVRENQIVGYGLVVGLQGSGDTLANSVFTAQSLQSMLDRMGVNIRGVGNANVLRTRNVAAVLVTADCRRSSSRDRGSMSRFRRSATPRPYSVEPWFSPRFLASTDRPMRSPRARLPSLASPCQAKPRALPKMWQRPGGFQMAP